MTAYETPNHNTHCLGNTSYMRVRTRIHSALLYRSSKSCGYMYMYMYMHVKRYVLVYQLHMLSKSIQYCCGLDALKFLVYSHILATSSIISAAWCTHIFIHVDSSLSLLSLGTKCLLLMCPKQTGWGIQDFKDSWCTFSWSASWHYDIMKEVCAFQKRGVVSVMYA